ncbi:phosphoglucomutase, alpha-D-glucose phosphate-specific [Desulfatibacillum aliphaticivorans]|uniref:Phosphoglucomutase, alpha-D-glucose phosphate-specific n=1 Tax=Desulfatibacillum aliphaticivorans TaxID=218208 RepID=B8FEY7_DESAL|nr:phosphoglucomutase (alpha-D-glucose-1,6-bisphosphate-dependent) [Desulfatibacillum aliphaticivorans]ACL03664.1 phosphoglucomutase, alpha-D-glucose phosphate-specific [Desulfatibacillum aliphaticivorans]
MALHALAGKKAPRDILENIPRLVTEYYASRPDPNNPLEQVSFGTSGHRGSSKSRSFNEDHILAVSQAICEYRASQKITGPLFMGMDTHALSEPAFVTALEVFAANGQKVVVQQGRTYTPTPVISHAILVHNRAGRGGTADGVVITPSHNPPGDGGFKYNPPEAGPAGAEITKVIQDRANRIMQGGLKEVRRISFKKAMASDFVTERDYLAPYVDDLKNVLDMDAISNAGLKIGCDPLGGSGLYFWEVIASKYKMDIQVVNPVLDPAFGFMTVDKDGKIRMDCSSPYAMAGLIGLKDDFDIAFGNDPDYDRHGIVTKGSGLMNPNHYLAVACWYLFANRPGWKDSAGIGKTLVSSSMLDRVAQALNRPICEVPVGFKWFTDGLISGDFGFAGEESAGASFLRLDGSVWTTDKDGFILDLLAAEITAKTGSDPGRIYKDLEDKFGSPIYSRVDAPASARQKNVLKGLTPDMVEGSELAGEAIEAKLTNAPGNGAAIGGLKVVAKSGWFAARPSGTEDIYKIYMESFKGEDHLKMIQEEAQAMVAKAFKAAGV